MGPIGIEAPNDGIQDPGVVIQNNGVSKCLEANFEAEKPLIGCEVFFI